MGKILSAFLAIFAGFGAIAAPYQNQGSKRAAQNRNLVNVFQPTSVMARADEPAAPVPAAAAADQDLDAVAAATAMAAQDEAQAAVDEIMSRYGVSRRKAANVCPLIADGVDKIKTFAGISTGAAAAGFVAGGAATATGFINDQKKPTLKLTLSGVTTGESSIEPINGKGDGAAKIETITFNANTPAAEVAKKIADEVAKANPKFPFSAKADGPVLTFEANEKDFSFEDYFGKGELDKFVESMKAIGGLEVGKEITGRSATLDHIRTGGSLIAGGAGVVSAATSFIGMKQLDDVIKQMDSCTEAVKEIDRIRTELAFADPGNPAVSEMQRISSSCSGMNSSNIQSIKGTMAASGVISSVGGALGIAGGITSLMATGVIGGNKSAKPAAAAQPAAQNASINSGTNAAGAGAQTNNGGGANDKKDSGVNLHTVSNALAAGTTVTSLASTIFGAVTVAGLIKNSQIADDCRGAF